MEHLDLARAIAHWLEYERLCGRSTLLSEAALKAPVGEFLISTQGHSLEVEVPYPEELQRPRGRRRSVDFCLRRIGGSRAWTNVVESKWVNGRRDVVQEIFDDLLRLEVVRRPEQAEAFERLFLVAGPTTEVEGNVYERRANCDEGPRVVLFAEVLPREGSLNVSVAGAANGVVEYWREAAIAINQCVLPLTIRVELAATATAGNFSCWIWRVSSVQNRSTRAFQRDDA